MDEKVAVNLGVFLLPSPALTIPFPPVNKFPNKLALNIPSNILKNLPLCLVSFSIATYSFQ